MKAQEAPDSWAFWRVLTRRNFPPAKMVRLAGVTAMETIVALVTVNVAAGVLTMLAKTAVIEVCPGATPVATPCWPIVATDGSLEAHVTLVVKLSVVASANVPIAWNCNDTPSGTGADDGVMAMDTNGEPVTTTAAELVVWTRRPPASGKAIEKLIVEVAQNEAFRKVIAVQTVPISAASDWTCRVLVGGLKPVQVYWYRFSDQDGAGSRVGRTITAPIDNDPRPVRFAFVSCQNANFGAQNAYRRMIYEDEQASEQDRLSFVLHLGDFIYEIVWDSQDRAEYNHRKVRDIVRYPHGEKIQNFHIPTDVDDYRAIYRNYLHDHDLQDARARFPFVPMWDNHEYSWLGWQGFQVRRLLLVLRS